MTGAAAALPLVEAEAGGAELNGETGPSGSEADRWFPHFASGWVAAFVPCLKFSGPLH